MTKTSDLQSPRPSFQAALVAGGIAGTAVDVTLFPIDTLKTRMQAAEGFLKAGGFRGLYNGLGAAAIGSAPGAALFFCTYETMKPKVLAVQESFGLHDQAAMSHMIAASMGEAAACLVRVPTEVVKANMQTAKEQVSLFKTVKTVLKQRHGGSMLVGVTGGLYRGFGITLFREVPFAAIQFPLYERLKFEWSQRWLNGEELDPFLGGVCGSVSGGIAAAFTTPLDVLKTRIMLGVDQHGKAYTGIVDVFNKTKKQQGYGAFFSGIQPRVMWISIGGFVFLGAYEYSKNVLRPVLG